MNASDDADLIDRVSVRRRALTAQEHADLRNIDLGSSGERLSFFSAVVACAILFRVLRRRQ